MRKIDLEKTYKYCCGCGLCNNYIEGNYDKRGFFRPNKKEMDKFDCSLCYCNSQVEKISDGLWGKYERLYYGYSNNKRQRKLGSSGGCFTDICAYLLKTKKVDYIVQTGKSEKSAIKTKVVYSHSIKDVEESCGSRYAASSPLIDIISKLKDDKNYAIIGKPCDIAVLRKFLDNNTEITNIKFLLSFFCGGTPSYQANRNLLNKMEIEEKSLVDLTYRGNGWPGLTTAIDKLGNKRQMQYEESWGKVLGRDLQEICRFCWDGVGASADISCGDGWYIVNGKPSFAEAEGRNVIFARNKKGDTLLKEMRRDGYIKILEAPINDLISMQPGQYMRKTAMFAKILAMRLMKKSTPDYKLKDLVTFAKKNSIVVNLKMFGGTIKRIREERLHKIISIR